MIRIFSVSLLAPLCLACAGGGTAEPQPSAADLERLLASLEAPPEREAIDADGRAKAERLLPTIEKMQPEKINPAVAGAFLAR